MDIRGQWPSPPSRFPFPPFFCYSTPRKRSCLCRGLMLVQKGRKGKARKRQSKPKFCFLLHTGSCLLHYCTHQVISCLHFCLALMAKSPPFSQLVYQPRHHEKGQTKATPSILTPLHPSCSWWLHLLCFFLFCVLFPLYFCFHFSLMRPIVVKRHWLCL